jgi:hypothetical protein
LELIQSLPLKAGWDDKRVSKSFRDLTQTFVLTKNFSRCILLGWLKKRISLLACLVLTLLSLPSFSQELTDVIAVKAGSPAKMTGDHIVIRNTPSPKKGKILGNLKNGEKIEIVEISKEKAVVDDIEYRWVRIKSDSFTGWCTDEFLTADMNYQSEKLDLPAEITVNCEYIDPVTVTFNVKKGPTEIFEYCSNLTTLSFKFSKNIVVDSLSAVISWGDYGTKPEDDDGYYIIQDTIVKSKPILLGHKIKDYYNFNKPVSEFSI